MQRDDRFDTGILRIAHVGLRFRGCRRVAEVRVAHQAVFEAERVNRFGQIGRERHDALHFRGNFIARPTSSVTVRRRTA